MDKAFCDKVSKALKEYYRTHIHIMKCKKRSLEDIEKSRQGLLKYYQMNQGYWLGKKQSKAIIRKRSRSLKLFYSKYDVWNKGLHWPAQLGNELEMVV